jgi:hypothetical protein
VKQSKKKGRPKKKVKKTSSTSTGIKCNSEIIITPINTLNTAHEIKIIQPVSIVNTVQSPQNYIVLKQNPLRNRLNKQM